MTMQPSEFRDVSSVPEKTPVNLSSINGHQLFENFTITYKPNTADRHLPDVSVSGHPAGESITRHDPATHHRPLTTHPLPGHHPTSEHPWVAPHHRWIPKHHWVAPVHHPVSHVHYPIYKGHTETAQSESGIQQPHRVGTEPERREAAVSARPLPNFTTEPGDQSHGLNALRHQVLYKSLAEFDGQSPSVLGERGLSPRLACARTVSTLLHRAIGLPVVDSVIGLEQEMRTSHAGGGHFEKFGWNGSASNLQPFDVVVGHRGMGVNSHVAIYTGNGEVFNNNASREDLSYDPVSIFSRPQTIHNKFGYADTVIYRWVPDARENQQYVASAS
jgi:hypothetical protein